uniref:Uncharacterized protein n=1 Tax=Abalone asfa-like virus TaxID=2839893 RepID=A0A5K7Y3M9_9VIRU|nr:hypothetical protein [Abalone asfa-like virus]
MFNIWATLLKSWKIIVAALILFIIIIILIVRGFKKKDGFLAKYRFWDRKK